VCRLRRSLRQNRPRRPLHPTRGPSGAAARAGRSTPGSCGRRSCRRRRHARGSAPAPVPARGRAAPLLNPEIPASDPDRAAHARPGAHTRRSRSPARSCRPMRGLRAWGGYPGWRRATGRGGRDRALGHGARVARDGHGPLLDERPCVPSNRPARPRRLLADVPDQHRAADRHVHAFISGAAPAAPTPPRRSVAALPRRRAYWCGRGGARSPRPSSRAEWVRSSCSRWRGRR
jgi:hypothetical protein